jgi:hypothetical protein
MSNFVSKGPSSGGRSDAPDTFFKDVTLTMWIPKEMAGKVIGKKGLLIHSLLFSHIPPLIHT